jgi:DeoR/GlpR family transcriptional regulator of sugar metabolism
MRKGKRSEVEVLTNKLKVLERICGEKSGVSISELAKEYNVSESTIKKYVEDLLWKIPVVEIKNKKIRVLPSTLEEMWSGTSIGDRIAPSETKIRLAQVAFSFIEQHISQIGRLILGVGTTVHKCACELMKGASHLGHIMRIHTANLLILQEFIWHKPSNLYIELPGGEVDLKTGTLWSEDTAKYFKSIEAQAVIASFSDMSFERGFCTIHHGIIGEQLAILKPNPQTCKWVIIPIEWWKIARITNIPVADSREEQLDFIGGKRKYVIITDRPSQDKWDKNIDDEKLADLYKWKETYKDGIEIIYA